MNVRTKSPALKMGINNKEHELSKGLFRPNVRVNVDAGANAWNGSGTHFLVSASTSSCLNVPIEKLQNLF